MLADLLGRAGVYRLALSVQIEAAGKLAPFIHLS